MKAEFTPEGGKPPYGYAAVQQVGKSTLKLEKAIIKRMVELNVPNNDATMLACAEFLKRNGQMTMVIKKHDDGGMTIVLVPKKSLDGTPVPVE